MCAYIIMIMPSGASLFIQQQQIYIYFFSKYYDTLLQLRLNLPNVLDYLFDFI